MTHATTCPRCAAPSERADGPNEIAAALEYSFHVVHEAPMLERTITIIAHHIALLAALGGFCATCARAMVAPPADEVEELN